MNIPSLDLKAQYQRIRTEIQEAVTAVIESQQFILGPQVAALESEVARYCGTAYGIGVSSGTDALLVSLMALEVGPGDVVVTTPYTFFATAGCIARLGAIPVFADINPLTYNLDPEQVQEAIVSLSPERAVRAKVLLPVHLFGRCAEMDQLREITRNHSLRIVEDAAQAIGARFKGQAAGSMGDLGCFSFFPSKNLGGFGDGGLVVTSDEALAVKVRTLRVHGAARKYCHEFVGGNFRLDTLQAAVLLVKLKYLDGWSEARARCAANYARLLTEAGIASEEYDSDAPVWVPQLITGGEAALGHRHVWNQFVIRAKDRDSLTSYLTEHGIGTAVYYPLSLHQQECFAYLGYRPGDFPESERAAQEALALPIFPELAEEQQGAVVQAIREFYTR